MIAKPYRVSIIIPARYAASTLYRTLDSLEKYASSEDTEIIIVNDGSEDDILRLVSSYPVQIVNGNGRGPAAARNIGVNFSKGSLLIFLDADCRVAPGWLETHLAIHKSHGGFLVVGGSVCMEPNAQFWARCDHYCSWYNVTPSLPASWVPNHPSANLSMTRTTFYQVGPLKEDLPCTGVHEETEWQKRFKTMGGRIRFEPDAAVWHIDRDDFYGFLAHNYSWGYNSIQVKTGSDVSRFPWVYREPWLLIVGFLPFTITFTLYTIVCWLRIGKIEPLFFTPIIMLGRLSYTAGMVFGWLRAIRTKK